MKKILLDENIAIKMKTDLIELKYDVTHIIECDAGIPDSEVFNKAREEERILISGDDDFKASDFKYKIPIVWITPNAKRETNVIQRIDWIIKHIQNYGIDMSKAFISIKKDRFNISYKTKNGVFAKIKEKEIIFEKIDKRKQNKKELAPN